METTYNYLRVNDIVFIEKGAKVECPECPAYIDERLSAFDSRTVQKVVEVGKEYHPKERITTIRSQLLQSFQGMFDYFRVPNDKSILPKYIDHELKSAISQPFCVPSGLYIILDFNYMRSGCAVRCSTYKPESGVETQTIVFYQDTYHPANLHDVKVVKDPENIDLSKFRTA